ncbi:RagB/SusD family nutrient uptake outer membrane protein [Sphingobacterium haloxyli]|uniref:RagB/SusD family nutrient uptake outer membrane protein n=1 Tax=Sphingobacterium haloxyli TaxID=2100533 RepID=A0A2S9J024_9SPHI|nr:RagB/SusD family nutrient uptake outer membrane protein [Sphingobacterium haloxyli]PRD46129.1 RagB/SusD family nutrient uptake outer membrane protein [Sphingobacterium haloxyli]
MKSKHTITIIFAAFTLSSCSEDFINLMPISQQSADGFYRSASDMEQAVMAAYDALQDGAQYGGNGFDHFMEVRSDNTFNDNTTQEGGARAAFDNFTLSPSNFMLNNTWNSCYKGIQRCNIVLNRIDAIEMDETAKTQRKGEVQFIRALTYFNLVRIWGDVPLVTNEIEDAFEAFAHERTSTEEVYAQIIRDLQSAAESLPEVWDGNEGGRATRGAAKTLLGKVYLTTQDYGNALTQLEAVINSDVYGLLPDFADVFSVSNKNHRESIFEVQYKSGTNGEGNTITDPMQSGDVNNKPSPNIVRLFEENFDNRFESSIVYAFNSARSAKRIDTRGTDGSFGFNTMVLRYADVLLMVAEALNEQAYGNDEAFTYLNAVRDRADASLYDRTSLPDQQSFREAIALERRLELAFENHRWFDLLRTGKALQVMNDSEGVSALPFTMEEHDLLFPIPQAQIDASSGKLTPNPGYN